MRTLLWARRCWSLQLQLLQHGWDTRCAPVVMTGEMHCKLLYCLSLVDIALHTVIPYRWGALELWSNQGLITLLTDVAWTGWKISPDEVQSLGGFLWGDVDVIVPDEFAAEMDSEVFCSWEREDREREGLFSTIQQYSYENGQHQNTKWRAARKA